MGRKIEKLFRAPYGVPNGLQVTDEGLWVADQITDRGSVSGDYRCLGLRSDQDDSGHSERLFQHQWDVLMAMEPSG